MRVYLVTLGVILCAVYTHSESRQYYPGVGYVTTGNRAPAAVQTSSRLRAAPVASTRNIQRSRAARLRDEYELIEREELSPSHRRSRTGTRNNNRRSSARRVSPGRRYRLARNEATTVAPPPASEPVASPSVAAPPQPSSSSSASSSPAFGSSPVQAFGGIFPNFQGGGGVTGGGYAQTNGPGAAFAAGFAQSSGSNSFAGGFGAVINHPRFPKFGGNGDVKPISNKDSDDLDDIPSSKDNARSDDSGFDDRIDTDDAERWFNKTSAYVYDLSSTVMTIKNWTESVADIAANGSKRLTDHLTIVPLKEMMMFTPSPTGKWNRKCKKCPETLVYVMTNGLQGKMFATSSKSFIAKTFKSFKSNQQPSTESPTSTLPPTTTTSPTTPSTMNNNILSS